MVFASSNQHYDIIIALNKCVYWIELVSQVSDVANGPLVTIGAAIFFSCIFIHVFKFEGCFQALPESPEMLYWEDAMIMYRISMIIFFSKEWII